MKKTRFTDEQIVGFLKQAEAGAIHVAGIHDQVSASFSSKDKTWSCNASQARRGKTSRLS
jgi:hypothetical protein